MCHNCVCVAEEVYQWKVGWQSFASPVPQAVQCKDPKVWGRSTPGDVVWQTSSCVFYTQQRYSIT